MAWRAKAGIMWRVPLAWLAAICVAIVGSVFFALIFNELAAVQPHPVKLLSDMTFRMPFVWLLAIYLGFGAAAVFLTPALLIAYAVHANRLGYVIAGVLAGLGYTLADVLHAWSAAGRASAAANHFWHSFDWMNFIHNAGARASEWFAWGASAMIAGALAGLVFAYITQRRAPEKREKPAVKIP